MESMANMSRLYNFSQPDKMSMPIGAPPSPPQSLNDDLNGPYYQRYWELMSGNVEESGLPVSTSAQYIAPYGAAPVTDPYFHAVGIQDDGMPPLEEIPWNVNSCSDPLFTHSRSTSYGFHESQHPYHTPPMDNLSYQPYADPDAIVAQQLENLSSRILSELTSGTAQQFVEKVASGSDNGLSTMINLFRDHKRIFRSVSGHFIDTNNIPFSHNQRVTRKVNMTNFILCIFRGDRNIPWFDIDDYFLELFVPSGSRLLKNESLLWLELKTQAFINVMLTQGSSVSKDEVLEKLFPSDRTLELDILRRRPEPTHLAPSEQQFISQVQSRRSRLESASHSVESLSALPQMYSWKTFLEEVANAVRKVLENIDSKTEIGLGVYTPESSLLPQHHQSALGGHHSRSVSMNALPQHHPHHPHSHHHHPSMSATLSASPFTPQLTFLGDSPASLTSSRFSRSGTGTISTSSTPESLSMPFGVQRSAPTSTPSKSSRPGGRSNPPNVRRPWTPEEEKALLDGLERVRGPHWSQILALYGAGGSIAETLKDRNQVQLKDKARNLKLFFLKSGVEVPGYLKRVTGELRTRAPGQAARRERQQRREEEERARRQKEGINATVTIEQLA
jgi:hypothetical protein